MILGITGEFLLACLCSALFLFVPGGLLCRAILGREWLVSFCAAPLLSVFCYCALAIAFQLLGVPSTWLDLTLPVLGCVAVVWIGRGRHRPKPRHVAPTRGSWDTLFNWCALALYVLVGIGVYTFVVLFSMNRQDGYVQMYDTVAHLGYVRSFVNSGNMSPIAATFYGDFPAITNTAGFYPTGMHTIAAMTVQLTGQAVTTCFNAVTCVFAVAVYPAGCFLMLRTLFPDRNAALLAGCGLPLAIIAFPWALMVPGGYESQVAGLFALPSACGLFLVLLNQIDADPQWLRVLGVFLVSVGGLVFIHTSMVFGGALFGIVMGLSWLLDEHPNGPVAGLSTDQRRRVALVIGALFVAGWIGAQYLPFLYNTTHWDRDVTMTFANAVGAAASFHFSSPEHMEQPQFGWILLVGAAVALFRQKDRRLIALALLGLIAYVVSASCDGFIREVFAGYWYNEPARMAGIAALLCLPLLCEGMAAPSLLSAWILRRAGVTARTAQGWACVAAAVVAAAVLVPTLWMNDVDIREGSNILDVPEEQQTPYDRLKATIRWAYGPDQAAVFTSEEQRFAEQALSLVPKGALVANEPNDGSAYLYGADGVNLLFRRDTVAKADEDLIELREGLASISSDPEVANAANKLGVRYVLILDKEDSELPTRFHSYPHADWSGIDGITEDTPGFKLLLSEGDMRFYKVELDDAA